MLSKPIFTPVTIDVFSLDFIAEIPHVLGRLFTKKKNLNKWHLTYEMSLNCLFGTFL